MTRLDEDTTLRVGRFVGKFHEGITTLSSRENMYDDSTVELSDCNPDDLGDLRRLLALIETAGWIGPS